MVNISGVNIVGISLNTITLLKLAIIDGTIRWLAYLETVKLVLQTFIRIVNVDNIELPGGGDFEHIFLRT